MSRAAADAPAVDSVVAAAYTVPTDAPEGDGTATWDATTLVLVRVRCGGTTGTGWTYGAPATAQVVTAPAPAPGAGSGGGRGAGAAGQAGLRRVHHTASATSTAPRARHEAVAVHCSGQKSAAGWNCAQRPVTPRSARHCLRWPPA